MLDSKNTIIKICKGIDNSHFLWFARLLSNHIEGILLLLYIMLKMVKLSGKIKELKYLEE